MQHYQTFIKRFENVGANIRVVNRFVPTKEMSQIKKELADGQVDIIIGTHKLLNKSFQYKSLGLLIIDEEQRFGVEHKEKIKEMKNTIDVLSLSATPIPRTLQMSLIGGTYDFTIEYTTITSSSNSNVCDGKQKECRERNHSKRIISWRTSFLFV